MNLDTFKLVKCFFSKQISDSDLNQLIMNKLMNKFCNNIRQILLNLVNLALIDIIILRKKTQQENHSTLNNRRNRSTKCRL